jgi:hypothetical protein
MLESEPGKTLSTPVIQNFVHARGDPSLLMRGLRIFEHLESLLNAPMTFWTDMLRVYVRCPLFVL